MNSDDGMGFMPPPPEQNSEVTSSTSSEVSDSRLQEIITQATVRKISKNFHDTRTVHEGLKSTAESYIEGYLESNPAMEDSLENLLDTMLKREERLKEELQDESSSSGQKTLVEMQDDIARELLAGSTVLQDMDFNEMLNDFKKNHTQDESLKCLDDLIFPKINNKSDDANLAKILD